MRIFPRRHIIIIHNARTTHLLTKHARNFPNRHTYITHTSCVFFYHFALPLEPHVLILLIYIFLLSQHTPSLSSQPSLIAMQHLSLPTNAPASHTTDSSPQASQTQPMETSSLHTPAPSPALSQVTHAPDAAAAHTGPLQLSAQATAMLSRYFEFWECVSSVYACC